LHKNFNENSCFGGCLPLFTVLWMLPDALCRRIYLRGGKTLFLVPNTILKPV